MCLQTYLYYYCKTLLFALETQGYSPELLYGICCVSNLCERWWCFFMPAFLSTFTSSESSEKAWYTNCMNNLYRTLQTVKHRCDRTARAWRSEDDFSKRYESLLLKCTLDMALEELEHARYNRESSVHVVYFDYSDSFLTSFTPVAGTKCFDGVPGIFSESEEQVVRIYLNEVRQAPTLVALAGIEFGKKPNPMIVETTMFKDRRNRMAGFAEFDPNNMGETEIMLSILHQWVH